MIPDIKVSLVQSKLFWENPGANREMFSKIISGLNGSDLIVLPEMFTTGFSMDSVKNAEIMYGETHKWMLQSSRDSNAAITGSLIIEEEGSYFNRMLFVTPEGESFYYDKRHLFRMADETAHFKAGEKRTVISYRGWRIFLQVCYDLRFPVFSRNRYSDGAWEFDVIIYCANWPSPRINAWDDLLRARAHENQVYVAGVNRVGEDELGKKYNGHSAIYSPKGIPLISLSDGEENVKSHIISWEELNELRSKFPIGLDADEFTLS